MSSLSFSKTKPSEERMRMQNEPSPKKQKNYSKGDKQKERACYDQKNHGKKLSQSKKKGKKPGIVVGEVGKYQILKFLIPTKRKCVPVKHQRLRRSSSRLRNQKPKKESIESEKKKSIEEIVPKLLKLMKLRRREWIGKQLRRAFSAQYGYLEIHNEKIGKSFSCGGKPSETTLRLDDIDIQYRDILCYPPNEAVVPFAYHDLLSSSSCWSTCSPTIEWKLYDSVEKFKTALLIAGNKSKSDVTVTSSESSDGMQLVELYVAREIALNSHPAIGEAKIQSTLAVARDKSQINVSRKQSALPCDDSTILSPLCANVSVVTSKSSNSSVNSVSAADSDDNSQYFLPSFSIEFLEKLHTYGKESDEVRLQLLNEAKQDAKFYFEQKKFKALSSISSALRDRFNTIGFAKWSKSGKHLPVLILNPYTIPPGPARYDWLQKFQLRKDKGNTHKCELVVYWYGEDASTSMSKFSIVPQHQVLSWADGCAKNYNVPSRALQQRLERVEVLEGRRKRRRSCRNDSITINTVLSSQEVTMAKAYEAMTRDLKCSSPSDRPGHWIQPFNEHHELLCDYDLLAYYNAVSV